MKTANKIPLILLVITLLCTPANAQKSALLWGTYFGGDTTTGEIGTEAIATDFSGNVYIIANTYSDTGLATSGAYQTIGNTVNGDAILAKFNPSGNLLWSTYFGGNGTNGGYGVATDTSGNVYIAGETNSTSGIATSGAYQSSLTGSNNIFLAKFSSFGSLQWATYYGGNKHDDIGGIATDTSGNIYIAGETNSTSGIATSGAYQTIGNSLNGDAFLAKFNPSGSLIWGTYFGGNKGGGSENVATDAANNVYMIGQTYSTSGIATKGAYQTMCDSTGIHAYLTKFSSSGSLLWATYFGGNGTDLGAGVALDTSGNVYITGCTTSTSGIATIGTYQTSFAGGNIYGDGFLAKFDTNGKLFWATYFGGSNDEGGNDLTVDLAGNIYVTGFTSSLSGIATNGAYQTSFAGGDYNALLAKFNNSGNVLWSTYYGGLGDDDGCNITRDHLGNVYIFGFTNSPSNIATSGAYQSSYGGYSNYFLAKFNIPTYYNDAGIRSILSPHGSLCAGSIPVKVQLKNYGADTLNSVKIEYSINDIMQPAYNWTGNLINGGTTTLTVGTYNFQSGNDTITAWTSGPNGGIDSFTGNDTSSMIDTVDQLPDVKWAAKINKETVTFTPDNLSYSSYLWHFGDKDSSLSANPSYNYQDTGTYKVSLLATNKSGCTAEFDSIVIIKFTGIEDKVLQSNVSIAPNPFTNKVLITYFLQNKSQVNIGIYDITGHQIALLCNENETTGSHEVIFDGEKQSPNIYIVKLLINNEVITQKMVKIN